MNSDRQWWLIFILCFVTSLAGYFIGRLLGVDGVLRLFNFSAMGPMVVLMAERVHMMRDTVVRQEEAFHLFTFYLLLGALVFSVLSNMYNIKMLGDRRALEIEKSYLQQQLGK